MIAGFDEVRDPYQDYNPLPAEPLYRGSSTEMDGEGDPLVELDEAQARRVADLLEGLQQSVNFAVIEDSDLVILAQIYERFPRLNPQFKAAESRPPVFAHPCECGLEVGPHNGVKRCDCGRAYEFDGTRVPEEDGLPFILQD